jgi:hypothetical protein
VLATGGWVLATGGWVDWVLATGGWVDWVLATGGWVDWVLATGGWVGCVLATGGGLGLFRGSGDGVGIAHRFASAHCIFSQDWALRATPKIILLALLLRGGIHEGGVHGRDEGLLLLEVGLWGTWQDGCGQWLP